jgi:hypothetical protein
MAKANEAQLIYLQARYTVTNKDVTTLVRRYLDENPTPLNDTTKVMKALIVAADS